jgi:hypothetical protein
MVKTFFFPSSNTNINDGTYAPFLTLCYSLGSQNHLLELFCISNLRLGRFSNGPIFGLSTRALRATWDLGDQYHDAISRDDLDCKMWYCEEMEPLLILNSSTVHDVTTSFSSLARTRP